MNKHCLLFVTASFVSSVCSAAFSSLDEFAAAWIPPLTKKEKSYFEPKKPNDPIFRSVRFVEKVMFRGLSCNKDVIVHYSEGEFKIGYFDGADMPKRGHSLCV